VQFLHSFRIQRLRAVADVLQHVGGFCAWRTRVSNARQIIERDGLGQIEWNGKARESAYRFVQMVPVQPDAAQQELFA